MTLRYLNISSFSLTGAIRTLFVAFYCMVFVIVSTVVYLDRQSLLDTLSHDLFVSKTSTLKTAVEQYINIPRQADFALKEALRHERSETVSVADVYTDIMNIMNDMYLGDSNLNLLQYANAQGDYIGVRHRSLTDREEFLTLKDASTGHDLISYVGATARSMVAMRNSSYRVINRPWYRSVFKDRKPVWTPIYSDLNSENSLGIAYSVPAFNRLGEFTGVISSELNLQNLDNMLKALRPYQNSNLIIVDENQLVVASSLDSLAVGERSTEQLPSLADSGSPMIANIGNTVLSVGPNQVISTMSGKERFYASQFPITDRTGTLKWHAIVIVPASAIISSVKLHDNFMILALILTFLLSAALVHIVLARITSPLNQIAQRTKELESGQWPEGNTRYQFKEIVELEFGFKHLSQRLSDSFEQLRNKIECDSSSGLYTRSGLINDPRIYRHHNLVALVHVTNMKSIMNTLGNKYADEFMSDFMRQAQSVLPTNIIVARDNIDMFIVAFPGMNQKSDYLNYERILNSLFSLNNNGRDEGKASVFFTGNAGMVLRDITPEAIDDILMHAWIALRYAEKQGNAQTRLYSPEMLDAELTNIHLHDSLSGAMTSKEIYLVMQPIVGPDERRFCRAGECLVRWHSEQLGEIPPEDFIPVAEESGLIIPLGRWIVEEACRELAAMIERGAPSDFRLHINISAIQLLQQGFAWHLMDTIRLNGLANDNICIEINTNVLEQDMEEACQVLNYLRRHHISICLDDFGAGFSSLLYLHTIPFDYIKISQNLIANRLDTEKSRCVFNSMLVLAKGFGVPLIAIGIEGEKMQDDFFALGCDWVQGGHFTKPAPFSFWHYAAEHGTVARCGRLLIGNNEDITHV